jgi:hypothetical protein
MEDQATAITRIDTSEMISFPECPCPGGYSFGVCFAKF